MKFREFSEKIQVLECRLRLGLTNVEIEFLSIV